MKKKSVKKLLSAVLVSAMTVVLLAGEETELRSGRRSQQLSRKSMIAK